MATGYAQKTLTKGTVKMEITDVASDDENMAMALEMMKGTETDLYFKDDKYVTKVNMMGGMVNMSTHISEEKNSFDMLMDAMGQKMWISSTLEETKNSPEAKQAENAKVEYDKADTKEILGYKCHKVTITIPDSEDMTVTGYVTEDIKTKANLIQGMQALQLNGFPMEFTVKNPMMSMTMKTTKVSDELDEAMLTLSTDGYKKMTMEEFQQSMGGMGGMGF